MEIATVECKCRTCGKMFTVHRKCKNSAEVSYFEDYAKDRCDECKDCYFARQKAEALEKAQRIIEENHLPDITGKSEKQIAYANDLRNRYLSEIEDFQIKKVKKAIKIIGTDAWNAQIKEAADKLYGGDVEAATKIVLQKELIYKYYYIWQESDAGRIIDILTK